MRLCERCHKERPPESFAPIADLGTFCEWCRENIQGIIDEYGVDGARTWVFNPRTDMIDLIEGEGKRVLDCGCWAGYTLEALRERGHIPYGLDIEDNRHVAKDCTFWKMDLMNPLQELMCGAVRPDCILFGDVLEHLYNPLPALTASLHWLTPGGRIIISVPNAGWIGSVVQIANQRFPRDESGHFDKTHLRFYTLDTLVDTVREAGFKPVAYYSRQLPDTPPWPEGQQEPALFQWDNLTISCTKELYTQLNTYQILLVAEPA